MAVGYLPKELETPYVTRLVKSFLTPQSRIQKEFGILTNPVDGTDGPNVRGIPARNAIIDLFDSTRTVAPLRSRDAGPATVARQRVGQIPVTLLRSHFKSPMSDNEVTRMRTLGGQLGDLDAGGKRYVMKQAQFFAQKLRNLREFAMGMMLRNGLYFVPDGEDFLPTSDSTAAGALKIDFRLPAGQVVAVGGAFASNLTLGSVADIINVAAPWSTAGTDIISDLLEIDQGAEEVTGRPFTHFWLNSATWGEVITNTSVKETGGSNYQPFETWSQYQDVEGKRTGGTAILRAAPHIIWHICNEFLIDPVTGSNVAMFPAGYIAAHADVEPDWFEFLEGTELQRENVASEPTPKTGISAWVEPTTQPSGFEMINLDNFIPAPSVPGCMAFFRVY